MKIIVFTINWNTADILPFFVRHYETFADEISVFDDHSTDGSREILKACPKVILRDYPNCGDGIDEDAFLALAYEWYPKAAGLFDWVIWVDTDEFIYHPNLVAMLKLAKEQGICVIQPDGYNMIGDGLPKDDGRQIWEICDTGVRAPVYSKPVIFQPQIEIEWNRGKHAISHCNAPVWYDSGIKLLHYRYLGFEYTKAKNAKNYARCGLKTGDKGAAWTCAPTYHGEHGPEWAEEARKLAFKII